MIRQALSKPVFFLLAWFVSDSTGSDLHPEMWVHVDTWLDVPHSYAHVGQHMALALKSLESDTPGLHVTIGQSQPLFNPKWTQSSMLPPEDASRLQDMLLPHALTQGQACPDVVFRAAFPLNASLGVLHCPSTLLFVHGTAEQGVLLDIFQSRDAFLPWDAWWHQGAHQVVLVTPSNWSATPFIQAGIPTVVIPHGVRSPPLERAAKYSKCLHVLSIGAMSPNKGIPGAMRALENALAQAPKVCVILVLKAPTSVYVAAKGAVQAAVNAVRPTRYTVHFHGDSLTESEVHKLYAMSDVYMSPWSAEGFGLTLAEAAAAGVPVVTTGLPPATEFLTAEHGVLFVDAHRASLYMPSYLAPSTCGPTQPCLPLHEAVLNRTHLTQQTRRALSRAAMTKCEAGQAEPWCNFTVSMCVGLADCPSRLQTRRLTSLSWVTAARLLLAEANE